MGRERGAEHDGGGMIGLTLLAEGAPERRKVDHLRDQIKALTESLEEIRAAPLPVVELVQQHMATLADDVERARQAVCSGGRAPADYAVSRALFDPVGWQKDLAAVISAHAGKPGLPADERRKKIAETTAKIATLEIAEETEIIRLEILECAVPRRPEVPISRRVEVWGASPS